MPELRLSDLRESNPGLAESPTLEMLLSDLRRQSEPGPTPTGPGDLGAWEPIVNAAVGSVYNPENPSLVHRAANTVLGVENPPQERLDAAMPDMPGKINAGTLKMLERRAAIYDQLKPFKEVQPAYEAGVDLKKQLGEPVGEATWYRSAARPDVKNLFESPEDWNQFLRFYASLSPQSEAATRNIDDAIKAFRIWKTSKNPARQMQANFMPGHADNLVRSLEDPLGDLSGPKVMPFNRAIPSTRPGLEMGDPMAQPFDRHMFAWYTPPELLKQWKGKIPDSAQPVFAQRGLADAAALGVEPREFQETVWRGYLLATKGPDYKGIAPLGDLITTRVGLRDIENLSAWAKKMGKTLPMALFALGAGTIAAPDLSK